MVVLERFDRGPSGSVVPICRWGVSTSMSNRNPMPKRKPMTAGITAHFVSPCISTAGKISDQNDAATITPAAKPNNDFCRSPDISLRVRNTTAEPSTMPSIGTKSPIINVIMPQRYNKNLNYNTNSIISLP